MSFPVGKDFVTELTRKGGMYATYFPDDKPAGLSSTKNGNIVISIASSLPCVR